MKEKSTTDESENLFIRKRILESAIECVTRDRNRSHGEPEDSFKAIAGIWSILLSIELKQDVKIPLHLVSLMMAAFKLVRATYGPDNPDNYVDASGYSAISGALAYDSRMERVAKESAKESDDISNTVSQALNEIFGEKSVSKASQSIIKIIIDELNAEGDDNGNRGEAKNSGKKSD